MMTPEEAISRIAKERGGTWSQPQVMEVETREPEVIDVTPLTPGQRERIVLPQSAPVDLFTPRMPTSEDAPLLYLSTREWYTMIWVPEREEYNHDRNVLILYGHKRVFRFTVWVQEGSNDDA